LILPDFTFISVPSRGDHWRKVRCQYRQQRPVTRISKPKKISIESADWDATSERLLQQILDQAAQEKEQVLARLNELNGFVSLTHKYAVL